MRLIGRAALVLYVDARSPNQFDAGVLERLSIVRMGASTLPVARQLTGPGFENTSRPIQQREGGHSVESGPIFHCHCRPAWPNFGDGLNCRISRIMSQRRQRYEPSGPGCHCGTSRSANLSRAGYHRGLGGATGSRRATCGMGGDSLERSPWRVERQHLARAVTVGSKSVAIGSKSIHPAISWSGSRLSFSCGLPIGLVTAGGLSGGVSFTGVLSEDGKRIGGWIGNTPLETRNAAHAAKKLPEKSEYAAQHRLKRSLATFACVSHVTRRHRGIVRDSFASARQTCRHLTTAAEVRVSRNHRAHLLQPAEPEIGCAPHERSFGEVLRWDGVQ